MLRISYMGRLLLLSGLVLPMILFLATPEGSAAEKLTMLQAASDEDVVYLRWTWPPGSLKPPAWQVYRQDKDQKEWKLLTPFPIARVTDLKKAKDMIGEEAFERFRPVLFPDLEALMEQKQDLTPEDAVKQMWGATMLAADMYPQVARVLGVRYEDRNVSSGSTYLYKLTAMVDGKEVTAALSKPVTVQKSSLPAPKGVTGEGGDATVYLRWSVNESYSSYDIYRGDEPKGTFSRINIQPVVIVSTRDKEGKRQLPPWFYVDENLTNDRVYYYSVQGRDYMGRLSRVAMPVKLTPVDTNAPSPPLGFKSNLEGNKILLQWEKGEENDLAGYNVYRSTDPQRDFEKLNKKPVKAGKTLYADSSAVPGVYYWYYATSVDKKGNESGMSFMALGRVADASPPDKPKKLEADLEPGKVALRWQPNSEPDMKGYRVYRSQEKDDEYYLMLNQIPVTDPYFTDVLPVTGSHNPFYYKITAVDTELNESDFSKIIEVRLPDVTPPAQPIFSEVRTVEGEILLTWHPTGDIDLAGYNVYRSTLGDDDIKPVRLNKAPLEKDVHNYKDSDSLEAKKKYRYTIEAFDEAGNVSIQSRPMTAATFDQTPPDEPSKVGAEVVHSGEGILVTWENPEGEEFKGVIVYRAKTEDGTFYPLTDFTLEGSFLDEKVRDGQTYWYRLAAFDASNNRSEFSRTVKATFTQEKEE